MIDIEILSATSAPWVHRASQSEVVDLRARLVNWSGRVTSLDAKRMRNLDDLFAEFASAFDFPSYFGYNWPAFDECMTALENVPAVAFVTIIENSAELLIDEPVEIETFFRILDGVSLRWARSFGLSAAWNGGEVPFHTILVRAAR